MKKNDKRHSCSKTLSYAPSSTIGPAEFEHALECDECWTALVQWMDAEANTLRESADILGRAKRLAGVGEIMAAMVTNGETARSAELPDDEYGDATLADVLDGSARLKSTLVRGPWLRAATQPTRSHKKEEVCVDGTKTDQSPSVMQGDECPLETKTETSSDPEEGECCLRWIPRVPATASAAYAVGPATAAAGTDAIEALRMLAQEMGRVADGLSVASATEDVCFAISSYSRGPLCGSCTERGHCRLKDDSVELMIRVPKHRAAYVELPLE
jgi:hypothetical protein